MDRGPAGLVGNSKSHKMANDIWVVGTEGLQPNTVYELTVTAADGTSDRVVAQTLPGQGLTGPPSRLRSAQCYCLSQDMGLLGATYPPAPFRTTADPVRLKLLVGDQIYMDLDARTGSPVITHQPDPWTRYREQWQTPDFGAFVQRSPTLCMADDHEYWNDYPHGDAWLPWAAAQNAGPFRDSYDAYQAALNLHPSRNPCLWR